MKNRKERILIVIWVVSMVFAAEAQTAGEFTIPLSDPAKRGSLNAGLNTGSITVRGAARKDILVNYVQRIEKNQPYSDCDDCEKAEDKGGLKKISSGTIGLEAGESSNQVRVSSKSWNNAIDLTIEVPSGMDIKVKTYNDGDIVVSDIEGEVEINNYNGEITAKNITGSVVASTYNGDIKVAFAKVKQGTPMSFSTYNGNIDLTLPPDLKATLRMKTEGGQIYAGFDIALVKTGPVQKKEAASGAFKITIDDWVKGDVNGGGPEFTMKSYNGDILIRKRP